MIVEFSHNNFLHAQVERSIQHVLGLEPIEFLQPSTQTSTTSMAGTNEESETKTESEQPTSPSHPLLAHVITCSVVSIESIYNYQFFIFLVDV